MLLRSIARGRDCSVGELLESADKRFDASQAATGVGFAMVIGFLSAIVVLVA